MNDPTLELARNEMKKYGLRGELVIEPGLPAFDSASISASMCLPYLWI